MLNKKEKLVMVFLSNICQTKKAYLVFVPSIAEFVSRKYIISIKELNSIMTSLASENYLDFVESQSKNGNYYVINFLPKGLNFTNEQKKTKQASFKLIYRTIILALFSFAITMILRLIFF